jgi:predicted RNA-binding Zn ribbon-like protein
MAFQLVAGHPALDFVNTLDWRFRKEGPEELMQSYDDLLRFTEQSKMLTPKQTRPLRRSTSGSMEARALERCTQFRESMAEILYDRLDGRSPSAASLKALERYFKAARLKQTLSWKESDLEWKWSGMERDAELPLWELAMSASGLMLSEDVHRVRACDNPECRWLFLDTSKNHTRRWCDMKVCGNRMKARRFKAQRKG